MRAAFLFDPDRCTGCEACRIACAIENNDGVDIGWRTLSTFNPARHPALPTRHLSLACNHCDIPACALGCPAAAYERDETTGAVILDPAKCIGCRYCSWLCPYDAPKFDEGRGVMTKCTFCSPRLAEGGQPACTAACPTAALSIGERSTGSERSAAVHEPDPSYHGLGTFGLGPALRVATPRLAAPPPALAIDEALLGVPPRTFSPRKITLASEWALLLFTIVMPALVAWLGGGVVRPDRKPPLAAFVVLASLALGISTIHLGKPLRAWRSVLNVRTSWLSREIVFANLFVALGVAFLATSSGAIGIAALAAGVALAFSIDCVYRAIVRDAAARMHSAEALPTMVMLFGIVAGAPLVIITAALLKMVLFASRWVHGDAAVPTPLAMTRVLLLAAASLPHIQWPLAFATALAGELIDRSAFYCALEPTTPARRMVSEMERAL